MYRCVISRYNRERKTLQFNFTSFTMYVSSTCGIHSYNYIEYRSLNKTDADILYVFRNIHKANGKMYTPNRFEKGYIETTFQEID